MPFKVAFQAHDLDFMNHELQIMYMENVWLGRHFKTLTGNSDERSLSYRNPLFMVRQVLFI